jgi:hypothetical protein
MKGHMQKGYGEQNRYRYTAELKMKINMAEHFNENILKL